MNSRARHGASWWARLFGAAMLLPALAHCAYVSDEPLIPMRTATSCGPFGGNWSVIQMRDKQPVQSARWTFTQGKAGCRFHSLSLDKASGVALKSDVDAVGVVATLQVRPGVVAMAFQKDMLDVKIERGRYVYIFAVGQSIDSGRGYFLIAPKCAEAEGCQIDTLDDLKMAIQSEKTNSKPNIVAILQGS
jgi:hypothetical protein